jgi:cytochrome c oxidase subunit 2
VRALLLSSPARRRFAATGLLTSIAILLPAGSAFAGILGPEAGGSPNADDIRQLYFFIFALACIIFFGVGGLLLYTLWRFRARKGAVAAQIHGNNRLEVGWTVGAALLLVLIATVTLIKLPSIYNPPNSSADGLPTTKDGAFVAAGPTEKLPPNGRSLSITVNGQQYLWRYTYADGDQNNLNNVFSYEEMVVPTNTTVTLQIRSQDVAHSWWIPKLGGKFDAIPGYTNYTWFKATKPGVFTGQCAELCGRNHANMTARVRAVPPAEFEAWYARQRAAIRAADTAAAATRNQQAAASKRLLEQGAARDREAAQGEDGTRSDLQGQAEGEEAPSQAENQSP